MPNTQTRIRSADIVLMSDDETVRLQQDTERPQLVFTATDGTERVIDLPMVHVAPRAGQAQ